MVVRVLLEGEGRPQQGCFPKGSAQELEADRQMARKTAGYRHGRNAGEVDGNGAHVLQIHGQRIAGFFAQPEGRCRCRRCNQDVHFCEGIVEILLDQGSHLESLEVVGVIVPRTQHIGTEHDAAFHFFTEALAAGILVHGDNVLAFGAKTIAHAVVTGQVGACLGRGDDIVGGQGVLGVGHGDFHHFRPQGPEGVYGLIDGLFHGRIRAGHEILLRQADAQSLDVIDEGLGIVNSLGTNRCGVFGIMTGNGVQHQGAVGHIAGDGPDLIQ